MDLDDPSDRLWLRFGQRVASRLIPGIRLRIQVVSSLRTSVVRIYSNLLGLDWSSYKYVAATPPLTGRKCERNLLTFISEQLIEEKER